MNEMLWTVIDGISQLLTSGGLDVLVFSYKILLYNDDLVWEEKVGQQVKGCVCSNRLC